MISIQLASTRRVCLAGVVLVAQTLLGCEHEDSAESTVVGGTAGVGNSAGAGAGDAGGGAGAMSGEVGGSGVDATVGGIAGSSGARGGLDPELTARFQEILDEAAARTEVSSAMLGVVTSDGEWYGAAGTLKAGGSEVVESNDAFCIHSVTKPITAAAVLVAVEQGLLDLDQPLAELLPADVTDGLHIFEGGDYSDEITIRQALGHRTGLQDVSLDGTPNIQGQSPFVAAAFEDPDKLWDPKEVIAWATEHLEPIAVPGDVYHYSDTNYMLLGLALEAAFERPLREIYRKEIYEPLGMDFTWQLHREEPRLEDGAALTIVYEGDTDWSTPQTLSASWGDGGLASTTRDLYLFIDGVLSGKLFASSDSLSSLLSYEDTGIGYEYGLGWARYDEGVVALQGHGGHGGSFMFYEQNLDLYLIGTVNQSQTEADIISPVIEAIIMSRL